MDQKTKNVALEKFLAQTTLKPCDFLAGEAIEAQRQDCLNIMSECHFWANVMLRQSRLRASRASPSQKSRGLRVVYSKNFSRATFFVFWVGKLDNSYLNKLHVKQI